MSPFSRASCILHNTPFSGIINACTLLKLYWQAIREQEASITPIKLLLLDAVLRRQATASCIILKLQMIITCNGPPLTRPQVYRFPGKERTSSSSLLSMTCASVETGSLTFIRLAQMLLLYPWSRYSFFLVDPALNVWVWVLLLSSPWHEHSCLWHEINSSYMGPLTCLLALF